MKKAYNTIKLTVFLFTTHMTLGLAQETLLHSPGGLENIPTSETLRAPRGEILEFDLSQEPMGTTAYNPSIPFIDHGREVILLRLEGEAVENDSRVALFDLNTRRRVEDAPEFKLSQDPFYLGQLPDSEGVLWYVIGMVKLELNEEGKIASYHDEFYKYRESITEIGSDPQPFAKGIDNSKDTRAALTNYGIFVNPRPQSNPGGFGGRGSIGAFFTPDIDSLGSDLHDYMKRARPETLIKAPLPGEVWWTGNNQSVPRPDGRYIDMYGHKAWWVDMADGTKKRDYVAIHSIYDLRTDRMTPERIIATAQQFEPIVPKFPDTMNSVVFPAGVVPADIPGKVWLYAGIGDRAIGRILLDDPSLMPFSSRTLGTRALLAS